MSAPNARALFAAAREDGPSNDERKDVFRKVALATGIATSAAAAATVLTLVPPLAATSAAAAVADAATKGATAASNAGGTATAAATSAKVATGTTFGMKLLALGAALGAASTALGVVLAMTVVTPAAATSAGRVASTLAPATVASGARLAEPATRRRDANDGAARASVSASPSANANATAPAALRANPSDDLAEEARLVTAARTALMNGDPARALTLVQATRKLSARSLEPEELGLEARALQALGRTDDAAATELVLRRRYPDHALAH